MAKSKTAIQYALEDIMNNEEEDTTTNVDEGLVEYDDSDIEPTYDVDEVDDALDTIDDASTAMEALAEKIETYLANGGMSSEVADMVSFSMEQICMAYGLKAPTKIGMESFDDANGRITNTGFALEAIKETLAKWYAGAVKLLNEFIDAIYRFWVKHLSATGRLEKAITGLKTKFAVRDADFVSKLKSTEITLSTNTQQALYHGASGSAADNIKPATIVSGLNDIAKLVKDLSADSAALSVVKDFTDGISKIEKNETASLLSLDNAVETFITGSAGSGKLMLNASKSNDHVKNLESAPIIGNKKIHVSLSGNNKGDFDRIASIGLTNSSATIFKGDISLPALTQDEAVKVLGAAEAVVKAINTAKNNSKGKAVEIKKMQAAAKKYLGDLGKDGNKGTPAYKAQETYIKSMVANARAIMEPEVSVQKLAKAAATAAYHLAYTSYKNAKAVK